MEGISPITRRIVAAGLLILGLLLALQWMLLPLISLIVERREELASLRGRAAHLIAIRDQPLTRLSSFPMRATIKASAVDPALQRMKIIANQAAIAAGVNIHGLIAHPPAADATHLLLLDIEVTGSEEALTRFANLLERGDPLVRFEHFRMQAGDARPMTLTGRLTAAWEQRE